MDQGNRSRRALSDRLSDTLANRLPQVGAMLDVRVGIGATVASVISIRECIATRYVALLTHHVP